jgi:putative transcriptional regulator
MPVITRVREYRTERGWSQAELAEHAGVSRQTINAIETGRYEPSLSLALGLAALFGVAVESLFSLDGTPPG